MPRLKSKEKKVSRSVYLTKEQNAVLTAYCEQTGLSGSAAIQMAFSVGVRSLQMAGDPEWQAFFAQQFRAGNIKLPKEYKHEEEIEHEIDQVISGDADPSG